MQQLETVLFPTDLSTASLRELGKAAALADRYGVKRILLHILPEPAMTGQAADAANIRAGKLCRTLRSIRREMRDLHLDLELSVSLPIGSNRTPVLDVARRENADLVLLDESPASSALLEAFSVRSSRHDDLPSDEGRPCPVTTIRKLISSPSLKQCTRCASCRNAGKCASRRESAIPLLAVVG